MLFVCLVKYHFMIKEHWKAVVGYEGLYEVSNLGRVRRFYQNGNVKILKQHKTEKGYLQIQLYKNGKLKQHRIHRLVATAFISNPLNLPEVNHKDENKENNFVWVNNDGTVDPERSNLEWVTTKQNCNHGTRNKRLAETQKNHPVFSKRVAQYTLGGDLVAIYPSVSEAARQTGFLRPNICKYCLGKIETYKGFIWKYV